ncbi:MAG: aminotransferase class III-fold pyridoxal phosphate-dependent enzyme [Melioribacteraceae bacterium]|nr:aminotransferase class III-fold pyridoxal phosphate-dependent enzyme [Melioribacteraceae bacterium]MCF8356459.1 aminotransferase class III-fold pyridoxal phosphate-dependent enzyme [Melioribacteraceae bacterium]MCF8395847.1 aminotransferase class III-fold pyridoxal phosphate-dependent enzyme [Melioribacteraceae bacterium]MCF8420931.1 aminotransferase class III-fold pyridoxal phosphate-dependent enzyme [Melioribacteraceae bacterium]
MPNGVTFNSNYPPIKKSNELYNRALGLIPSVTQTMAKGPSQYVDGIAPKYLVKGKGSHVWDVDGNEFIDFNMGIGPLSLGYAYPKVDEAIKNQLRDGITFSMMHPLEVEVAEIIRDIIPNAEMIRYSKTGSDVTSAAVRLARSFTGREKILMCGYHGWHDWYVSVTAKNKGIPKAIQDLSFTFNYNDIDSFKSAVDNNVAAVILEPIVFQEPKNNFLHEVAEICQSLGIVLIFDEMWTGFRLSIGGAQEYFCITPDLATYSKAVANGMPLSILAGKKEIMKLAEEDIFFYTTFGGEALSLAAAKVTIQEIIEKNVPSYLNEKGKILKEGYNSIAKNLMMDYTKCSGYNCRTIVSFDQSAGDPLLMKSLVQQEMIKHGILWSGFHNMCYSHNDQDINYTLRIYEVVLPILKNAVETDTLKKMIKGIPVQPVFRKTENFNIKPVIR